MRKKGSVSAAGHMCLTDICNAPFPNECLCGLYVRQCNYSRKANVTWDQKMFKFIIFITEIWVIVEGNDKPKRKYIYIYIWKAYFSFFLGEVWDIKRCQNTHPNINLKYWEQETVHYNSDLSFQRSVLYCTLPFVLMDIIKSSSFSSDL